VCFLVIYFQCSAFHAAATKEWWNVGASGQARTFEGEPPCPFKTDARSPFLDVPGGGTTCIKTDLMHTFNLGVGGDLSASSIVALCNLGQFRGRGLPSRLDHAYETFACWCRLNKKTVSTKSFEKKKFHMKSFLGETSILLYCFCGRLAILGFVSSNCFGVVYVSCSGTTPIPGEFPKPMMSPCSASGWGIF
jgi:hypothetical protein